MKSNKQIFFAAAITLAMFGCSNTSDMPATSINAQQFSSLYENKDNDGKRLSITGYPYISSDVIVGSDMKILIAFYTEPKGQGEAIGSLYLAYKEKKNGVYIPQKFTAEDLQVFDNDGNQLSTNDKVTTSFTMKLDTKHPSVSKGKRIVNDENGHPKMEDAKPRYNGEGPTDIKIEKAK